MRRPAFHNIRPSPPQPGHPHAPSRRNRVRDSQSEWRCKRAKRSECELFTIASPDTSSRFSVFGTRNSYLSIERGHFTSGIPFLHALHAVPSPGVWVVGIGVERFAVLVCDPS
eukprot:2438792-Rhodomonas_salina.3